MSSPTQSNSSPKKPLTRTDKFIVALFLFIALWMIADAVVFNHQRTVEMLARNAHASYCDNAPECYMVGEDGMDFGELLDAEIGSEAWSKPWNLLDLDKLARAVEKAETGGCVTGSARFNNCFGVMVWDSKGNRSLKKYENKQASRDDFKAIWSKNYGGFPNEKMAHRWTGGDKHLTWLAIVKSVYYSE